MTASTGYVLRRALEKRRRSEGLRRRLQALGLHQGLKRAGLSMSDLDKVEESAADWRLMSDGLGQSGRCEPTRLTSSKQSTATAAPHEADDDEKDDCTDSRTHYGRDHAGS